MNNNNFTIVRLILATLVVFGHFKTLSGYSGSLLHSYADFAVDAFFIVSGFLVYGSFDKSPKLKGFYIKRFFRIYPLYFFMIVTQAIIMLILLGERATLADTALYLASNLVFANFISPDIGGLLSQQLNPAINPSLWTLKIEVAFYLIVPLVWWGVQKMGMKILPLIYIASTIYAAVAMYYGSETWEKQLPGQMRFFVVGIWLYYLRHSIDIKRPMVCILSVLLFAICTMRHFLPELMPIYPMLVGALIFIVVLRLPSWELKYDISYGVYLIHAPLIQLSLYLGLFQDDWSFLLLIVAMVYILGFLSEKLIEQPLVRLGRKYAK